MYFDLLVLDAYYDLDKIIEEPFDDAEFGSNEKQKNGLEVLLKEVAAKSRKENLNWACEKWMKKVNKFRKTVYEVKKTVEVIETLDVSDYYQNKTQEFTNVSNAKGTNEIGPHYQDGVGAEEDVKKDNGNNKNEVFIYETRISKMDDRPLRIIGKAAITGYMSGMNDPNKGHEVKIKIY
ncbi:hypothetical protein F8M41_014113 [Gigaspora margarita]|uniref:Uncharacterized protein n=1 Tax=Gigaspora margarita TaxID=4874 RepID=A0A8H4A018_GIGMA|nr:hypothetical protein F8M41_014113 [Gigaspora margarita]